MLGCSSAHSGSAPTSTSAAVAPPVVLTSNSELPELAADPREKTLAEAASVLLSEQHVLKKKIDDSLSKEAFPKFIEQLDGAKLILLETHVTLLGAYADKMDDELEARDLSLARKGAALIGERRKVAAMMVADILSKPLDLTAKEEIETDAEKRAFCKTDAELRDRWRGVLKLQLLERLQQMDDLLASKDKKPEPGAKEKEPDPAAEAAAAKALAAIPPTFEGREEKARKELATRYETRFVRLAKSEPLEPAEEFINAIAAVYDPHTSYLAPNEKANFDIAISGTLEGIGAVLGEQDHYIAVQELVPGGASWQQGKLEAGDLILAVAQEGSEPVDVTDMPIDKVVTMIRGKKGTVVVLTVKKPEGRIDTIAIKRDVIKVEATFARGAVLSLGAKKDSVGYIYLPGFYGDIGSGKAKTGERNATDDVRALLQAFQKKSIANVIIDLRGNGGGLLTHARDISGLFIETGPVVQTRDSGGDVEVLADKDPSVSFDGNLVVMVDRFSASAAEILSGALQDYERAVVVGTGPTHGKGTVQAVIDLDRLKPTPGGDPLGIFKITTQQYYRVSGASTQLKGVVPDILLPDPASFVESGERKLFHPIPWSSVDPVQFKRSKHDWKLPDLQAKSRERASKSALFAKVEAYDALVTEKRKNTTEPVDLGSWQKRHKENKAALDAADPKLSKQKALFEVTPIGEAPTPGPSAAADKTVKKKLDAWKDDLARDPWVEEALLVLGDMAKK